jgi:DNA-directed RNA polymerase subunit RPC12/RpoP
MVMLRAYLQRWWPARHPHEATSTPYEVVCSCGRSLRGQRQRSRQVVTCPNCGRKRFVLPSSPWPQRDTSTVLSPAPAPQTPVSHGKLGRLLLVVIVGGAAAMGLLFLLVKPYLRRSPAPMETTTPAAEIRAHLEAGRNALRDEAFRLAVKELNAASAQRDRNPDALSREEHRQLNRLRRQSDLLAHLLDRSLEEILRQAMQHRNEDEWREKFEDYRGRAVLFDDVLRLDPLGRPILGFYVVRVGEVEARVALENLLLLTHLPLDPPPQRWLFGARLASCRREDGGVWVFRFEPESAVLLTDEGAAAACCPGPMDAELRAVLRRQDEILP